MRSSCSPINLIRTSVPTSLRVQVPGIYISDIAIWYGLLLDEQILQLYRSGIHLFDELVCFLSYQYRSLLQIPAVNFPNNREKN